ncbi:hypothetical protein [Loktanella sp. Alg231-35]|uniref:hypothetical protein n=1 Tax=Loktanella sp. Alg231-35 TaxID=1922220 RepID=UPI000D560A06|nr:hypothetical protein [Loktanella sp. Alg231-35]
MLVVNFGLLKEADAKEVRHEEIDIMTGAIDAIATESSRFPSVDSVVSDIEERWDTSALVA